MLQDILPGVLAYFRKLAQIPRPSGHEQAVSDFLVEEFKQLGCKVIQDESFNVIADLPATVGNENAPLTILQSHMDMVCVAAEGVQYNPLTDAIRLIESEEYLQADGTSLGSDDGTGIAEILYIFANLPKHGPLRAIITVDEEVGMKGASSLSREHLLGARYLINCDSEDYDILTVGCAGSVNMDFSAPVIKCSVPEDCKTWQLTVSGLRGGHSGERIGDGRANAIKTMGRLLSKLMERDYVQGITAFKGGVARNAIPAEAQACFASNAAKQQLLEVIEKEKDSFSNIFVGIEDKLCISLQEAEPLREMLDNSQTERLLSLISLLHSGIFAMSTAIPGLVETSANLGTISMKEDIISLTYFPRSSIAEKLEEIVRQGNLLANLTGFTLQAANPSPAWQEKRGSKLAAMLTEIFLQQNGKPMQVNTIHAGLECGYHYQKNPQLDMVSIGVTTLDIHSPAERLVLATVEPQVKLICEALQRITEE